MKSDYKLWCLACPEPDQAVVTRSIHHAKTKERLPYDFCARGYRVVAGLISGILALLMFLFLSVLATIQPIRFLFVQVR